MLRIFKKNNKEKQLKKHLDELLKIQSKKYNLSAEELKEIWLKNYLIDAEESFKNQFNQKLQELRKLYAEQKSNIILDQLNRLNYDFYRDIFVTKVKCSDPDIKKNLIGLNGRNKKSFEKTCCVELIINENDEYITLSSTNHIKREIANNVLNKLIKIKNIEPNKITNIWKEEKIIFDENLVNIGKDVVEKKLLFNNIDPDIYKYIGKLKYRYSYGQNNLEHSLECAYIAEQIAKQIGVDSNLAKMCAFFHDIGKSEDHETSNDHVSQGVIIAKQCNLPIEVISSIKTHHEADIVNYVYDSITKIADKLSSSKPGARKNSKDDFLKRAKTYEDICMKFPHVKKCYALKSGFLVRIIIKPNSIKDDELEILAHQIRTEFEKNEETNKYIIGLELIKENTYKTQTQKKI